MKAQRCTRRHWYPVSIPDTLDMRQPQHTQLLGMSIVLWNDGPTTEGHKQLGNWHASIDLCTHRQNTGKTKAGGVCSCHEFSSLDSFGQELPSKVVHELLWVFPYVGSDAFQESDKVALPLCSELTDPALQSEWSYILPGGIRDFPCGWDALAENCLDPAHFTAAHHGMIGNRYKDPAPYTYIMTEKISLEHGFALSGDLGKLEFRPPCLVKYHPNSKSMPFKEHIILATYCVPIAPGDRKSVV
eukprot:TRINITY_DN50206_c0_g1_i1.p1 TRINITY_DN50206_c0_g1~~TRINITY_DN50206_c0_g1_i1.p1  ORF type:complete len:244 (-),score=25.83 TRINITY_DN50206_c0_g1_i1:4-735(-)